MCEQRKEEIKKLLIWMPVYFPVMIFIYLNLLAGPVVTISAIGAVVQNISDY